MNKLTASTVLRIALSVLFLPAFTAPCALVRASLATQGSTTATPPARTIDWGPCEPFGITNSTFSCGFLAVPLDYHDPSAGTGRLAVVKANATEERCGSLLHNPGGPGVSGLQTLTNTSTVLEYLRDVSGGHYDIVSWDPRGVGAYSIPGELYCFDSADEYDAFFNGTIEVTGIEMYGTFTDRTDLHNLFAQADTMETKYRELGKRCAQREGPRMSLKYVGTAPTARDLVALADALDGPGSAVHYYGHSYGTLLGVWFVNMFPERVGKVILDGVVDPAALSAHEVAIGWQKPELHDADRVYEAFVTGCALAGPEHCALARAGETAADVHARFQEFLKTAHDAALRDPTVTWTSDRIRAWFYLVSTSPQQWQSTANTELPAIMEKVAQEAIGGAHGNLDAPARRAGNQTETPSYSEAAIFCADSTPPSGTLSMADVFAHVVDTSRHITHMFGAMWPFNTYYCSFWPARGVERYAGPLNSTLAAPIIVIGNTYDPATPFSNAKHLAALLGDSAALVRLNGFGHVALALPSACVRDVVRAYIVNGTVPDSEGMETVCEADEGFEVWPGVDTKVILGNMSVDGLKF